MSNKKVKIKINRYMLEIGMNDYLLDNGACIQVASQKRFVSDWQKQTVLMSKKLFNELRKHNYIFIDEQLTSKANENYSKPFLTYFRFDIDKMIASGDYKECEPNIEDDFEG